MRDLMNLVRVLVVAIGAHAAMGEDVTTLDGTTYKGVRMAQQDPATVEIVHEKGIARVRFANLPANVRGRFPGYDEAKAKVWEAKPGGGVNDVAVGLAARGLREELERFEHRYVVSRRGIVSEHVDKGSVLDGSYYVEGV